MTNSLKFNVDESIWFKQGDEIDNILSISLEPDINVEETGDYVTIKGSLRLGGEYERSEHTSEKEETLERSSEQMPFRSVQEVRKLDDNVAEFQHHFPVEITIPNNRVESLDDIVVTVESFDYRIPNASNLQMSAELAIEGIQKEQTNENDPIDNYDFEERVKDIYVKDKTSFMIDSQREEVTMDLHEVDEVQNEHTEEEEERQNSGPQFELKSREEENEPNEALESLRNKSEEDIVETLENEEQPVEVEEVRTVEEVESDVEGLQETNIGEIDKTENKQKTRSENALYLTKMLTREEEQFSRLRMRIIQPGESLDSIAESYELQPTQIARLNRLHDEQVEEGQILYIPVKSENQS